MDRRRRKASRHRARAPPELMERSNDGPYPLRIIFHSCQKLLADLQKLASAMSRHGSALACAASASLAWRPAGGTSFSQRRKLLLPGSIGLASRPSVSGGQAAGEGRQAGPAGRRLQPRAPTWIAGM